MSEKTQWDGRKKNRVPSTYILHEMEAPALVLPANFGSAFQSDKEFALEVEELVKTREQEVYCIL